MAKISANGATKVAELKVKLPGGEFTYVYVMCSDGRVLRRNAGPNGGGYVIARKVGKLNATAICLRDYVERMSFKIV